MKAGGAIRRPFFLERRDEQGSEVLAASPFDAYIVVI
jgi:hypothetical protein